MVDAGEGHVDLDLSGMSCASCAVRVETTLNKLDGVTATVNFATEKASVHFDASELSVPDLVAAVESIGYGAVLAPEPGQHQGGHQHDDLDDRGVRALRTRVVVSALLAVPVVLLAMVPWFMLSSRSETSTSLASSISEIDSGSTISSA